MATKNPRVHVTLEEVMAGLISQIAKKEHKSVSSVARELITEALELREDMALSLIAEIRDTKKAKRIKHDQAWK